jgi:signal transduction histidine kinase
MLILASWFLTAAFAVLFVRSHWRLVLVARASHELRGPLSAVQLGLAALTGEPARVAAIELELARAGRALEDLAAAPAGARGRTDREVVDLAELVASYAPAWESLAAAFHAELALEPAEGETRVVADPLRLAQACSNLVGNAAEHGGGVVRVCVCRDDAWVQVHVTDDGPGLPPPSALSARVRTGQRGHGLAITAAIIEQHCGRLATRDSTVMFELPAA